MKYIKKLNKEIQEIEKEFESKREELNVGDLMLCEAEVTFMDYIPEFHRLRLRQMLLESQIKGYKDGISK